MHRVILYLVYVAPIGGNNWKLFPYNDLPLDDFAGEKFIDKLKIVWL